MKNVSIFFVLIFVISTNSYSGIIHVPADMSTIQSAINISSEGDTILVSPGIYHERITFGGKSIVVGSMFLLTGDTTYITSTILDGDNAGSTVKFNSGETPDARLSGLFIRNGRGTQSGPNFFGAGIYCKDASPTLDNLLIMQNEAPGMGGVGGGIFFKNSNAILKNSLICSNSAYYGGGIRVESAEVTIENTIISNNYAVGSEGGIMFFQTSLAHVSGCIFTGNSAIYGGAISCVLSNPVLDRITCYRNTGFYGGALNVGDFSSLSLINSILWENSLNEDRTNEILLSGNGNSVLVAYSDVRGGQDSVILQGLGSVLWQEGNIDLYPLFEDTLTRNVHLQAGSPCINAGTPFYCYSGDTLVNITGFWGTAPDMGAYEYSSTVTVENKYRDDLPGLRVISDMNDKSVVIRYILPADGYASLSLVDISGRYVRILKEGNFAAGEYLEKTDMSGFAPGLYLASLRCRNGQLSKKFVIPSGR